MKIKLTLVQVVGLVFFVKVAQAQPLSREEFLVRVQQSSLSKALVESVENADDETPPVEVFDYIVAEEQSLTSSLLDVPQEKCKVPLHFGEVSKGQYLLANVLALKKVRYTGFQFVATAVAGALHEYFQEEFRIGFLSSSPELSGFNELESRKFQAPEYSQWNKVWDTIWDKAFHEASNEVRGYFANDQQSLHQWNAFSYSNLEIARRQSQALLQQNLGWFDSWRLVSAKTYLTGPEKASWTSVQSLSAVAAGNAILQLLPAALAVPAVSSKWSKSWKEAWTKEMFEQVEATKKRRKDSLFRPFLQEVAEEVLSQSKKMDWNRVSELLTNALYLLASSPPSDLELQSKIGPAFEFRKDEHQGSSITLLLYGDDEEEKYPENYSELTASWLEAAKFWETGKYISRAQIALIASLGMDSRDYFFLNKLAKKLITAYKRLSRSELIRKMLVVSQVYHLAVMNEEGFQYQQRAFDTALPFMCPDISYEKALGVIEKIWNDPSMAANPYAQNFKNSVIKNEETSPELELQVHKRMRKN